MKHEICPVCASKDLGDQWFGPRMLKQYCHQCGWWGEKRIPEQQEVTGKQTVSIRGGSEFTIYDRYGHVWFYSQSYPTEDEALEELQEMMKSSATDEHCGPYTAVLWPARVEIQGKIFHGVKCEAYQI